MLKVSNISKAFLGRDVLCNITMNVEQGEVICLLGPSGCGKTTLLNIIAGTERADSGYVEHTNGDVAMLFQDRELLPWRNVIDNITLGAELQGEDKKCLYESALSYMSEFGLSDAQSLYPDQISGGMKRRAALAQLLMTEPETLLLDEPLNGLDVMGRRNVSRIIKNYIKDGPRCAVIVTHSIEEALFLADRIIILSPKPAMITDDIRVNDIQAKDAFSYVLKALEAAGGEGLRCSA